jgi:hypothetical protein
MILTDPTFDAPGEYPIPGGVLVKQSGPAIAASSLPSIDVVALSHAHHPDNLDTAGAAVLGSAGKVLGTAMAKDQIDHVTALAPWESVTVAGAKGLDVIITAVPEAVSEPVAPAPTIAAPGPEPEASVENPRAGRHRNHRHRHRRTQVPPSATTPTAPGGGMYDPSGI